MTSVSDTVVHALSCGSLSFAVHGSFFNHFLIGQNSSTANQNLWNKRLLELPWRTKCKLPCERTKKAWSETDVKSYLAFCLGSFFEKEAVHYLPQKRPPQIVWPCSRANLSPPQQQEEATWWLSCQLPFLAEASKKIREQRCALNRPCACAMYYFLWGCIGRKVSQNS